MHVLTALLGYSDDIHEDAALIRLLGTDAHYNRVLATSLNDQSPIKTVLSDEGETLLKRRKFTEKDECNLCPIFHVPFDIDEEVTELPCGHIFSPDGIEKWLKEEKSECPICRFKLASKEITQESPGIEQWVEDRTELSASRAALATNLRRLTFPQIGEHPFGPASHRIANVVHEDDDRNDIMRALSMTLNGSSAINNIINYHMSGGNMNINTYINDNGDYPNYYNMIRRIDNNTTTPMTYITMMAPPVYADATTYENNQSLDNNNDDRYQSNDRDTSAQDNQRTPDNSDIHMG